jgi:hypothetical protein
MVKFENDKIYTNIGQALDECLEKLEDEGIGNGPEDPEVTIILSTNGTFTGGEKNIITTIYVDSNKEEIGNDIKK